MTLLLLAVLVQVPPEPAADLPQVALRKVPLLPTLECGRLVKVNSGV
jgi:hypothetical protein